MARRRRRRRNRNQVTQVTTADWVGARHLLGQASVIMNLVGDLTVGCIDLKINAPNPLRSRTFLDVNLAYRLGDFSADELDDFMSREVPYRNSACMKMMIGRLFELAVIKWADAHQVGRYRRLLNRKMYSSDPQYVSLFDEFIQMRNKRFAHLDLSHDNLLKAVSHASQMGPTGAYSSMAMLNSFVPNYAATSNSDENESFSNRGLTSELYERFWHLLAFSTEAMANLDPRPPEDRPPIDGMTILPSGIPSVDHLAGNYKLVFLGGVLHDMGWRGVSWKSPLRNRDQPCGMCAELQDACSCIGGPADFRFV